MSIVHKGVRLSALALACSAMTPAMAADWPSGFTKCTDEGESCKAGASARQVSFGSKDKWVIKTLSGTVACQVATFGSDPNSGRNEKCALGPVVTAPAPAPAPAPTASCRSAKS